jgi:hypothetical protein
MPVARRSWKVIALRVRVVHREELGALHAGEREAAAKLARRGA